MLLKNSRCLELPAVQHITTLPFYPSLHICSPSEDFLSEMVGGRRAVSGRLVRVLQHHDDYGRSDQVYAAQVLALCLQAQGITE